MNQVCVVRSMFFHLLTIASHCTTYRVSRLRRRGRACPWVAPSLFAK
jgi:hypothetical protein